ncbi:hypothetical protein N7493_007631 [Penicillium malachiteum]|uniref:Fumarylacetoacetase-like C-terminal domain-containing protein n=1 Tax=Penicillium malachiteum TaxID=1324776 RepID=A0AAD6HII3_9EURO|nr:hypothetical protein N7493_007631 [Penicillium malachiteum]
MTGTPAGVGVFQKPRQLLKNGDVMEVEITGLGKSTNKVAFEEGQDSILAFAVKLVKAKLWYMLSLWLI